MRGRLKKICGFFCLIGFLFATPGCERQPEAPKKPKVISKKITRAREVKRSEPTEAKGKAAGKEEPSTPAKAPKTAGKEGAEPAGEKAPETVAEKDVEPAGEAPERKGGVIRRKIAPRAGAAGPAESEGKAAEAPEIAAVEEPEKEPPVKEVPVKPRKKAFQPKSDVAVTPIKSGSAAASKPGGTGDSFLPSGYAYSYNPEGKIDPFAPIFRKEAVEKSPTEKRMLQRKVHIPRTPLERIDISQLKLTAVITAPSGNKALVEEATGKGYVIKIGTGIGTRWGKVVEIQQDRVIVEEETQDALGNWTKRKREIKLQKPIGD